MTNRDPADLTGLLLAWGDGDGQAMERLMAALYDELRRLARIYLRSERSDHTLGTAGLVNETYLRLIDQRRVDWRNRDQFVRLAARLMRRVLIDHARRHQAAKRGAGQGVPLVETGIAIQERPVELIALGEALARLSGLDPRQSRVVELRYLMGLSLEETARMLDLSLATVKREWTMARAFLARELGAA